MKGFGLKLFWVTLMLLFSTAFEAAIADKTLILYLPFDEGGGKKAKDQSQYSHDAEIIANIKWVDGKFGKAISIIAEGADCVNIPHADTLKVEGEITMMAWLQSAGWAGDGDQWIDKNCHNGGEKNCYGIGVFGGSQILLMLGATDSRKDLGVKIVPKVNAWEHVAATYDGQTMKMYLNGDKVGEKAEKFKFAGTNNLPLRIGCAKDRARYTFNGAIDEVVIFSRALDAAEIKAIMNSGLLAVSFQEKLTTTWGLVKQTSK